MDIMELLKKARAGDKEARNKIVEENVGLVWNIVKRFTGRGYDVDDIFQIGCIGLIKAIDNFDMQFGVKFSTYAVPMITGEVKRFLRDDGMIKVSRTIKENGWKIKKAADTLGQKLGRTATINEIAAVTELTPEDIVLALEANSEVDSIYRTVYQSEGKDIYMVDQIVKNCQGSASYIPASSKGGGAATGFDGSVQDEEKEKLLNHILLKELLAGLDEKERKLIEYRYYKDMTQTEVAKELGISQVQVSRLEKKILKNLREKARC
ncbi:MAG: sigma-70 family RNA polymerase sigma factor [Lachnospiraceae bacterium]|nr:sigma-70 family RNA polymerase sigma factor [Lachnospiraceae bacterium]